MGLSFCCPACGAALRVNPDTAVLVSCPGCGEPIRVPRRPHPVEATADAPLFASAAATSAVVGFRRLTASAYLFAAAVALALTAVGVRVAVAGPPAAAPWWGPAVVVTLAVGWGGLGLTGCGLRYRGYTLVRPAAAAVDTAPWAKAAAAGTGLSAVGVVAVAAWLVGRSVGPVPTELVAVVLIGLVCGLVGLAVEFAFLTVVHRLLWEAAGWQAASHTGRYTLSFVFTAVAAMGSVSLGGMVAVIAFGGREREPGPLAVPPEVKWVAVAVLAALAGCAVWVVIQYVRLLTATRRAMAQPEPYPPPVPQRR